MFFLPASLLSPLLLLVLFFYRKKRKRKLSFLSSLSVSCSPYFHYFSSYNHVSIKNKKQREERNVKRHLSIPHEMSISSLSIFIPSCPSRWHWYTHNTFMLASMSSSIQSIRLVIWSVGNICRKSNLGHSLLVDNGRLISSHLRIVRYHLYEKYFSFEAFSCWNTAILFSYCMYCVWKAWHKGPWKWASWMELERRGFRKFSTFNCISSGSASVRVPSPCPERGFT